MQWLLPEGVEEVLPPGGWALEALRRKILDQFQGWNYQLILPPMIEHADALLSGVGADLQLQTFRLTDQLSGRQLGLRADITPQAARIDARHLADQGVVRLCYLGTVLRTRPETLGGPRCLRQFGAELFGHDGLDSDIEIIELMLASLRLAGVSDLYLDLGHVAVFRALAKDLALDEAQEQAVFDLLQSKAAEDLAAWCDQQAIASNHRDQLVALCQLHGGIEVLAQARERFAANATVIGALDELQRLTAYLSAAQPDLPVHIDLAELSGYRYQTGLIFAAFSPGQGRALARGGRYNGVGADFGADRPATGFSADLTSLWQLAEQQPAAKAALVRAPSDPAPALAVRIDELRAQNYRVQRCLDGAALPDADYELYLQDGAWQLRALNEEK